MKNFKRRFLPLRHGINLSKTMHPTTSEKVQRMNRIPYISIIGSLMYVMLCTRLNIALVVSVTSRYQSNPSEEHLIAMKNIFKYLRRTKNLFLIFRGDSELQIEDYTDSDFMSNPNDKKSISRYVFICNGAAVS